MTDGERAQHQWEHALLSEESKAFLHALEYEQRLEISGKIIHVIHYAMNNQDNYLQIRKKPKSDDLESIFQNIDADVILYGHEHHKSILKGSKFYINPGSVGCPGQDFTIARAGVLTVDTEIDFTEITVEYDVDQVLKEIDKLNYPDCQVVKRIFYGVE